LAISKDRKNEIVAEYTNWANRSQALIIAEYKGLTMKQIDEIRNKVRESGGEFHIVKNTLGEVAFKQAGMPLKEHLLEGSTAVAFAFKDAPILAKMMTEFARTMEPVKIKGGYLDKRLMSAEDVKSLADLPPLPVMRATLLGTILAPASKLVRTLAEPGRQVAAVLKAFADRDSAAAPAAEGNA
jgi:large subunit ribosomal protein L10